MKTFELDENGDVIIENNNVKIVEGREELIQQIKLIFRSKQGEWFFNEEYGLNYDNLFQKKVNLDLIRDEIKNGLSQCSAILSIDYINIEFNKNERKLKISFGATNTSNESIKSEEIISL